MGTPTPVQFMQISAVLSEFSTRVRSWIAYFPHEGKQPTISWNPIKRYVQNLHTCPTLRTCELLQKMGAQLCRYCSRVRTCEGCVILPWDGMKGSCQRLFDNWKGVFYTTGKGLFHCMNPSQGLSADPSSWKRQAPVRG